MAKCCDFKFNFNVDNSSEPEINEDGVQLNDDQNRNDTNVSEINPKLEEDLLIEMEKLACHLNLGNYAIRHLTLPAMTGLMKSKNIDISFISLTDSESDLVPGVYEGGLKVWECSIDLAAFLQTEMCFETKPEVLELGCGAGLPGIVALTHGCHVTFQDYNKEVLEMLTFPNILLNTPNCDRSMISKRCNFISGHWNGIKKRFYEDAASSKRYQIILTSETIYERSNQRHLLELMKSALTTDGSIYLAAKTHYFGVGGTLENFIDLVKSDGQFTWQVVKDIADGVSRKIIKLKYQNNDSLN